MLWEGVFCDPGEILLCCYFIHISEKSPDRSGLLQWTSTLDLCWPSFIMSQEMKRIKSIHSRIQFKISAKYLLIRKKKASYEYTIFFMNILYFLWIHYIFYEYTIYFEHYDEKLKSMGCATIQLLGNSKPVIERNIKIENKTNIKNKTTPKMRLATSSFFYCDSPVYFLVCEIHSWKLSGLTKSFPEKVWNEYKLVEKL